MKIAYLDCFSGISGDMFLGALIDCGFPRKLLKKELAGLSLGTYKIKITSEYWLPGRSKLVSKKPPAPKLYKDQKNNNRKSPQPKGKGTKYRYFSETSQC
jgi:hypothetical protein